jgi:hypothetical protein
MKLGLLCDSACRHTENWAGADQSGAQCMHGKNLVAIFFLLLRHGAL